MPSSNATINSTMNSTYICRCPLGFSGSNCQLCNLTISLKIILETIIY